MKLLIKLFFIISIISANNLYANTKMEKENNTERVETATFAGGCFWCMQPPFDKLDGVVSTFVGYTGGATEYPTYEEVCSGSSGHAEAIEVVFDPSKISYTELLNTFWRNINPTTLNGQFADRGTQYRTAIFYHSDDQQIQGQASKDALQKSGKYAQPIVTEITQATTFYKAEEYHQKYYMKDPYRYKSYKIGSGRADHIKKMWGDGDDK